MAYADLLKDPRWQKNRLQIMERDGFRCSYCDSETHTLHVHHGYYEKGKMPWEYPDETLYCLCEKCHREVSCDRTKLERAIGFVHPTDYDMVYGFVRSMVADRECDEEIDPVIHIESWMSASGVCRYWRIRGKHAEDAVIHFCDDNMNISVSTLVALSQETQNTFYMPKQKRRVDNAHP